MQKGIIALSILALLLTGCQQNQTISASEAEDVAAVSITFHSIQDDCAVRVRILTTKPADWYSAVP